MMKPILCPRVCHRDDTVASYPISPSRFQITWPRRLARLGLSFWITGRLRCAMLPTARGTAEDPMPVLLSVAPPPPGHGPAPLRFASHP